jgi:hypothetical protein
MSRHVLFLFMDGVGLGTDDPAVNPLAAARMPQLRKLLGGQPLVASAAGFHGERASVLRLDAQMGVEGTPQSATGQAALLTGKNVSQLIGGHYGPKPNPEIAAILEQGNLFSQVVARGGKAALLNAYPPQYFANIESGRRLYSSIPLAADAAGLSLKTAEDLVSGQAFSADFTGAGWASQPNFPPAPIYNERQAGQQLALTAGQYQLAWFDYWASDYAGHKQAMQQAVEMMEGFDGVLGGLLSAWDTSGDLIILTSDHGNMEDMSVRGHTRNPVPGLLIGPDEARRQAADRLTDLTDLAPFLLDFLFGPDREGA